MAKKKATGKTGGSEGDNKAKAALVQDLIRDAKQAASRHDVFKARDILKQAVENYPDCIVCWHDLGVLYEKMGNNPPGIMARQDIWRDALDCYARVVVLDPARVEARYSMGIINVRLAECSAKEDETRAFYQHGLAHLATALAQDATHERSWYASGVIQMRLGNQQDAILAFTRATRLDPTDVDAWWNLGLLHERSGNDQQSLDAFEKVRSLNKERACIDEHVQRLRIKLHAGEKTPAAREKEGRGIELLVTGQKLVKESNFPKAIQFLSNVFQIFKEISNVHGQMETLRYLAAANKGFKRWAAATGALNSLRDLSKDHGNLNFLAEAHHNLGFVYFFQSRFQEAIDNFLEATALHERLGDKQRLSDGFMNLGKLYRETKDHARAIASLETCLRIDIELNDLKAQAQDLQELASIHAGKGDIAIAIKHYENAIEILEKMKETWKINEIKKKITTLKGKQATGMAQ